MRTAADRIALMRGDYSDCFVGVQSYIFILIMNELFHGKKYGGIRERGPVNRTFQSPH